MTNPRAGSNPRVLRQLACAYRRGEGGGGEVGRWGGGEVEGRMEGREAGEGFQTVVGKWRKASRWTKEENLLLWECYSISTHSGGEGEWQDAMFAEWRRRDGRRIQQESLVARCRLLARSNILSQAERDSMKAHVDVMMREEFCRETEVNEAKWTLVKRARLEKVASEEEREDAIKEEEDDGVVDDYRISELCEVLMETFLVTQVDELVEDALDVITTVNDVVERMVEKVEESFELEEVDFVIVEDVDDVKEVADVEDGEVVVVGACVKETCWVVDVGDCVADVVDVVDCIEDVVEVVDVVDGLVDSVGKLDDRTHVPIIRVCETWRDGELFKPVNETQRLALHRLKEVYAGTEVKHIPSLKNKRRDEVNKEVALVNGLLHNLTTNDITEVNRMMYAGAFVVADRLGMIKERIGGPRKVKEEPHWKRRIERKIKGWRKDLALVEEVKLGRLKNSKELARLARVYGLGAKGILYVIEFLKGKIHAGSCKVRDYLKRNMQYQQNNLFKNDQKQLYSQLSGETQTVTAPPDKDEATKFWSGIWSKPVIHNDKARWISQVRGEMRRIKKQDDLVIGIADVKGGIRRMTNWKAPGPDGIQGFWFKAFTNVHTRIADGLQECLTQGWVPKWMTVGRTSLFMKDPVKGTAADNYRPIACLPLMWKLLTGIFAEKMYQHLEANNLLPDEQKGCRKRSRGTKDQLLIDKMILKDAKRGIKNLSMAWIDYKKAYDMVPHSWLLEVLDIFGVAGNIAGLVKKSMETWQTQLMGGGDVLGTVDIKRGIFQGDSLSPLLFVMIMIPLSRQLNATGYGYKLRNTDRGINHLLFMDDLKLYASNDRELDKLVVKVKDYSDDIGMEFGMSKCETVTIKRGKRLVGDGLKLPSGEVMKDVEDKGYKYLGVLQKDSIMYVEMKKKVKEEYFRRLKCLLKSELYAGNLIAGINAWAIGIVRYTAGVLDWGKTELAAMDVKTRKTMTLNGAFHMRSSVDRLYLKRKDGGRGLISVTDCVRMEEENLLKYVSGSDEWMLQKVLESGIVKGCLAEIGEGYKKKEEKRRTDSLWGKRLFGRFFRGTKKDENGQTIAGPRSWEWVRAGYMTKSTEAYLFAAQEQAISTNARRSNIYHEVDEAGEVVSGLCRVCGKKMETVFHIAGGCDVLMLGPGMVRHDRVGARVHWELCKKYGVECSTRWYEHQPETVCQNASGDVTIFWDMEHSTLGPVKCNKPDVVVADRGSKLWTIIDFAVPLDHNIVKKEQDKIGKYHDLAQDFRRRRDCSRTKIIPIVVGALGTIPEQLPQYLEEPGIPDVVGGLQKSALLGTRRILKNVLSL